MAEKQPLRGETYLYKDRVFKVERVSRGTDEVLLEDIADGKLYSVRHSLFKFAYERVLRVGEVAKLLGRHSRSIYRYEDKGVIRKPKVYNHKDVRLVRFYTLDDVVELHEMISQLHQGRPRKDKKVVNNTVLDAGSLRILLRERYGYGR